MEADHQGTHQMQVHRKQAPRVRTHRETVATEITRPHFTHRCVHTLTRTQPQLTSQVTERFQPPSAFSPPKHTIPSAAGVSKARSAPREAAHAGTGSQRTKNDACAAILSRPQVCTYVAPNCSISGGGMHTCAGACTRQSSTAAEQQHTRGR
jgi:hypothetical protein